jgi:hypothetical protein
MTDAIDATERHQQRAPAYPPLDRAFRHTGREQLRARDDSMLRARKPRELALDCHTWTSHTDAQVGRFADSPPQGSSGQRPWAE